MVSAAISELAAPLFPSASAQRTLLTASHCLISKWLSLTLCHTSLFSCSDELGAPSLPW